MKIVVIGGTGLIGSKVVEKLKAKGHEAIAAAPNTGVNTITGEGLIEALRNAQVVVDVANSPSFDDQAAMDFFQTAGKNLTTAEVPGKVKDQAVARALCIGVAAVLGVAASANGLFMLASPEAWYFAVPGVTTTGPFDRCSLGRSAAPRRHRARIQGRWNGKLPGRMGRLMVSVKSLNIAL
ncbi:MAG: NAD-dependent epimerase/dehydratase family protein [Rhodospirillales bacterium]|nr:NAD-dependent epimerase/dehydratase family protein [Rhodospirillales bacterium]